MFTLQDRIDRALRYREQAFDALAWMFWRCNPDDAVVLRWIEANGGVDRITEWFGRRMNRAGFVLNGLCSKKKEDSA